MDTDYNSFALTENKVHVVEDCFKRLETAVTAGVSVVTKKN